MEKIRIKMQELRDKTTASLAEEKKQQEEILRLNGSLESKRAEIQRIETKLSTYEEESDQIHKDSAGLKLAKLATESASKEYDYLTQRVQVLEKKLDEAERALKEARDKLRNVDTKAEHFERQLDKAAHDLEEAEKEYDELSAKNKQLKAEVDKLESSIMGA